MRIALSALSALLILFCMSQAASAQTAGSEAPPSGAPSAAAPAGEGAPPEAAAPPADPAEAAAADGGPSKPVPPAAAPPAVTPSAKALAAGVNGFGWELYRSLAAEGGNVFLSPLSAAEALAMVHAGAGGATKDELGKALEFPFEGGELAAAWGELRAALKEAGGEGGALFALADSLWPDSGAKLKKAYLDALSASFGPAVFPVDYVKDAEGARAAINDWTLDVTNGRISDLVASPLPASTVLVLVNAVYFKGRWSEAFDPAMTAEGDFKAAGGKVAKAMFMGRNDRFRYLEDDLGQVLEMPYLGGRLSMAVLLPKEGEGELAKLEKGTTGEGLSKRLEALAAQSVNVKFPRFKFSWGSKSLKDALGALGVKAAFGGGADFSGMSEKGKFKVSDVLHKAFVEVNEEGTEAAAATAVGMMATSMPIRPTEFVADRPFLFLIRDNASGAVIFLGRLSDPS